MTALAIHTVCITCCVRWRRGSSDATSVRSLKRGDDVQRFVPSALEWPVAPSTPTTSTAGARAVLSPVRAVTLGFVSGGVGTRHRCAASLTVCCCHRGAIVHRKAAVQDALPKEDTAKQPSPVSNFHGPAAGKTTSRRTRQRARRSATPPWRHRAAFNRSWVGPSSASMVVGSVTWQRRMSQ